MRSLLIVGATGALVAGCGDSVTQPETQSPAGAIALAVGEMREIAPTDAATIHVSGGVNGAEFVLVPFYASHLPSATLGLEFSGERLQGITGAPAALAVSTFDRAELLSATARASFDARLRRAERALAPRMSAARATWAVRQQARMRSGRALNSAASGTATVGEAVRFNVAEQPCDAPDYRSGHVVAVSERAIIVADDANPPGGLTGTDYAAIAQAFADSVYPLDTRNFGTPSDIDGNGRIVIFFSRAVNELTPPNAGWYVGGFFHPRDLFPRTSATSGSTVCAGSNDAEMFYMLVPDPTGAVNGNQRTVAFVKTLTTGVLAHELQHLINASRRMYVNDADGFEEIWLNEGLSHVAEELMFYQAPGLTPRQNLSRKHVGSSQAVVDAFNAYEVANFARLYGYLTNPEQNSPYADSDDLATRGATWQLLRYAADHSSATDEQVWQALVRDTRLAGFENLTAVFGDVMPIIRSWSTAQFTDDLVLQTTSALQQPSWDYRSLFSALLPSGYGYPLKTRSLVRGVPVSLTLYGGGAAYLRFAVAGGATGAVHVTSGGAATPAELSLTLVRTQ